MLGRVRTPAGRLALLALGAAWGPVWGMRSSEEGFEIRGALEGETRTAPEPKALAESQMQHTVAEVSSTLSALGNLSRAFEDFPAGRCGWLAEGGRTESGQAYAGPGFAGALRGLTAATQTKVLVHALLSVDGVLARLLEALESCEDQGRGSLGPRAALELVALVREEFPDLAATDSFLAYRRDLHLRWQTKCWDPDYSEFKQRMECQPLPAVKLPRDLATLIAAYNRSQLVVHLHSSGHFSPFLKLLAADEVTALSTSLFGDVGQDFSGFLAPMPWQFLFDGPSIQQHGFLACNRDAFTINRLSQGAAEEVVLGSMHKSRRNGNPLQRRLPDGMQAGGGDEQPCIHDVKDFMQASCGILSQGKSSGPDTEYTEVWFARAPLRGAVGVYFNMQAARSPFAVDQLPGQVEELQRLRAEEKFAALGDLLLVQGAQLKDSRHVLLSTTSFRVPPPGTLREQLVEGTRRIDLAGQALKVPAVSGLDVRHLHSVDGIAGLWRELGPALVAAFHAAPLGEYLMALPTLQEDLAALDALVQ